MRAWIGVLSAAVNTLPRLRFRRELVCGSRGTAPRLSPLRLLNVTAVTGVLFHNASFFGQRTLGMLGALGMLRATIVCA